jgi:hypothetical protein
MPNELIENMTASGPSLREWVQVRTGCDPITEPEFAWSNIDACSDCGVHDSTAVLSFDGKTFERLCFHCADERA